FILLIPRFILLISAPSLQFCSISKTFISLVQISNLQSQDKTKTTTIKWLSSPIRTRQEHKHTPRSKLE
ncbi:unnamed protein product, partial [Arabidopsis halleri]